MGKLKWPSKLILFCLTTLAVGCSSSVFTGSDKDDRIARLSQNNQFSEGCEAVSLGDANLDPATARALVKCLNAHGAIPEFEELVESLSDDELDGLLPFLNESLIANKTRMRELDLSLDLLESRQILGPALSIMGKLLKNTEFITSLLTLLDRVAFDESNQTRSNVQAAQGSFDPLKSSATAINKSTADGRHISQDLLRVLQNVARDANPGNVRDLVEVLTRATQRNAFHSLVDAYEHSGSYDVAKLQRTVDSLSVFVIENSKNSNSRLQDQLLDVVKRQTLFNGFDLFMDIHGPRWSNHPTEGLFIDHRVKAMDYHLNHLFRMREVTPSLGITSAEYLNRTNQLFRALNQPLTCFETPSRMSNPLLWVLDQIGSERNSAGFASEFLGRRNLLILSLSNGLCALPSNIGTLTSVLPPLVESGSAELTGELVRSLAKAESTGRPGGAVAPSGAPAVRLLVDFLTNQNLSQIAPLMAVLLEKMSLADTMYLLSALSDAQTRSTVSVWADLLGKPRADLAQRSVSTVLANRLALLNSDNRSDLDLILNVAKAGAVYLDKEKYPEEFVAPLASMVRASILANNLSPVQDLLFDLARNAERNSAFFESLFKVSQKKAFRGALSLMSRMAIDGSFSSLLRATLGLFRGGFQNAPVNHQIAGSIPAPLGVPSERDRSHANLPQNYRPPVFPLELNAQGLGCATLNPDVQLNQFSRAGWERQVRSVAACVNGNSGNQYSDVESLVNYAFSQTVPSLPASSGILTSRENLAVYLTRLATDLVPSTLPRETRDLVMQELGTQLVNSHDDVRKAMGVLELLLSKYTQDTGSQCVDVSLVGELLKLGPYIAQPAFVPSLNRFMSFAGAATVRPEVPAALSYINELASRGPPSSDAGLEDTVPLPTREEVTQVVRANELPNGTATAINNRVNEVYRQYFTQLKNDEARFSYASAQELQASVRAFLVPLARRSVEAGVDRRSVIYWLMSVFEKFNGNPYSVAWLAGWFKRLSQQYTVIYYYYPNDDQARVRIVNDLDRLEILVTDGDFKMNDYGFPLNIIPQINSQNISIKYLSYLGVSRDEPMRAISSMEAELDFFWSMRNDPILGATIPKPVKKKLSNLRQVVPVLSSLYRDSRNTGVTNPVNDVRIICDLAKAMLNSTPTAHQGEFNKELNNIEALVQMTHVGILRNVARLMQALDVNSLATARPVAKAIPGNQVSGLLQSILDLVLARNDQGGLQVSAESLALAETLIQTPKGLEVVNGLLAQMFEYSSLDENKVALMKRSAKNTFLSLNGLNRVFATTQTPGPTTPQALTRFLLAWVSGSVQSVRTLVRSVDLLEFVLLEEKVANVAGQLRSDLEQNLNSAKTLKLASLMNWSLREVNRRQLVPDVVQSLDTLYLATSPRTILRSIRFAWNQIVVDTRYALYQVDAIVDRFLAWFGGGTNAVPSPLALRIQQYLGQKLGAGDFTRLLLFTGCYTEPTGGDLARAVPAGGSCQKPTELYDRLQQFARPERTRQVQDFLDVLHSALIY